MGSIGSMVRLDNRISYRRDLLTSVQGSHDTLLALYLMISGPHDLCSNCTSLSQTSMWLQTALSRLAGQSILKPLINLENAEVKVPQIPLLFQTKGTKSVSFKHQTGGFLCMLTRPSNVFSLLKIYQTASCYFHLCLCYLMGPGRKLVRFPR